MSWLTAGFLALALLGTGLGIWAFNHHDTYSFSPNLCEHPVFSQQ